MGAGQSCRSPRIHGSSSPRRLGTCFAAFYTRSAVSSISIGCVCAINEVTSATRGDLSGIFRRPFCETSISNNSEGSDYQSAVASTGRDSQHSSKEDMCRLDNDSDNDSIGVRLQLPASGRRVSCMRRVARLQGRGWVKPCQESRLGRRWSLELELYVAVAAPVFW